MKNIEPTLEGIEDYHGKESSEKRMTVWIVILSGLLIGAIYSILGNHSTVSDELSAQKQQSGIFR
ncbi:MAG TPA: hypothetical protein ENL02_01200 [Epsilonproteobacteria bacterium]|nr:hypothetical protein [Campylobacterota bacterium]